jgi:hypothetical protein
MLGNVLIIIYITIWVLLLIYVPYIFGMMNEIKDNWTEYRCNPMILPIAGYINKQEDMTASESTSQNFTYCTQNIVTNFMGSILDPIYYIISQMTNLGGEFGYTINQIRGVISSVRSFISTITGGIMNSFSNIIVAFMKTLLDLEDMIGKMIGIAQVLVYLNLGLYDTVSSIENSKEFKTVIGFLCFHPDTIVKKINNELCKMSELSLGDVLDGNSEILIILKIKNKTKEKLYKLKGLNNTDIYVTGSHLIYKKDEGYILVKDHPDAIPTEDYNDEYYCFITSNSKIKIGKYVFHDWEDDYEREKLKYKKC